MVQRRTNNNASGGIDLPILAKKTKQILAKGAGNLEYANLTRRGRYFLEALDTHTNRDALEKLMQEILLWKYFDEVKSHNGYTIETIPLGERGRIKKVLWDYHTNWKGEKRWSPILISMYNEEIKAIRSDRRRWAYLETLEDFDRTSGLLGFLAASSSETDNTRCDTTNPEFVRLLYMHDGDQITPLVSGKTGAGKTNFVLYTIRQTAYLHRGYTNPTYGRKASRIRAYLPNFEGHTKFQRQGVFPGIYSSFSYTYPWQVFVDEPKGSSILWTKYDWSMDQEEADDDTPDIFAIFYAGEIGLDKLRYPMSKEITLFQSLFQLTRQMRIRYVLSSANPDPLPVSTLTNFVNPQIWIDKREGGNTRYATAEYVVTSGERNAIQSVKLGIVPEDPLTKIINRGIASDLTAQWEKYPFQQVLVESKATNMNTYLKEPDKVIEAASQITLAFQDRYLEEKGEMFEADFIQNRREDGRKAEAKSRKEEDNDESGIFM